jgi:1,4-dihydroxy-2-naphthoate octaprenyltransferase
VWVLIGAVASHASVNAFNEYFDFKSGLDATTVRTPFSGGSGTLPANPALAHATLAMASGALVLAAGVGIYVMQLRGWGLLPLGLMGLVLVVTYTTWWAHNALMCLIAPGLGIGVFMVMGTHFALTGEYSWTAFVASLCPAFLVSDLLLLNQFPDVEADRAVGRKNYPITHGRRASSVLYGTLLVCAYMVVIAGVLLAVLPAMSLLAMLTLPLAFAAWRGARDNADDVPALLPAMRLNVIVNLLTPALLAMGLLLSARA